MTGQQDAQAFIITFGCVHGLGDGRTAVCSWPLHAMLNAEVAGVAKKTVVAPACALKNAPGQNQTK
jgi:hypothetical protein